MMKSKKILGMMMALALVICSNGMTASATTITTDVYSGVSAYTYYVRKSEDSSSVLGKLRLTNSSTEAVATFTASQKVSAISYASYTNSGFVSSGSYKSLSSGTSVIATKRGSGITRCYGYCSVKY